MRKRNPSPISTPPSEQTTAEDSGGDSAAEEGLNNQEVSKDSVSAEKCDLSETEKDSEQVEEEQTTKLADGYYEIEAVRRKRVRKGQVQYLIKWRGWPETENTWEPYKNLLEVSDVIDTFEESLKAGKSKLRRKKKRQHSITHVLPKKKQRQQSPPPATYSVDPHVIQIADEGIPFPTLNDLVDRNEDSEVNANGVNIDELSEKTNENGVSIASPTIEELKELSDLDLKLCELKRERATSMESTHTVPVASGEGGVLTSTKELQAMYRADAAQPGRKTGAKKRKSGTVKRFKKDPASCSVEDAKILEVPSVRYPDLAVNSKNKHEDCYSSCAITQILRPISYSSSISNNVQDVLVAFEALRADGSKVTVDNKFLKANNPHLLIDYYERNLRYNQT